MAGALYSISETLGASSVIVAAIRSTISTVAITDHAGLTLASGKLLTGFTDGNVVALDPDRVEHEIRARHTIVATGGAGQCFAVTTNPSLSTGDGIAMALRSGVAVADVEFMQFHPTALHHPSMPRPLLSEALRGHYQRGRLSLDELAERLGMIGAQLRCVADTDGVSQGVERAAVGLVLHIPVQLGAGVAEVRVGLERDRAEQGVVRVDPVEDGDHAGVCGNRY